MIFTFPKLTGWRKQLCLDVSSSIFHFSLHLVKSNEEFGHKKRGMLFGCVEMRINDKTLIFGRNTFDKMA